jgi:hypothetical protein
MMLLSLRHRRIALKLISYQSKLAKNPAACSFRTQSIQHLRSYGAITNGGRRTHGASAFSSAAAAESSSAYNYYNSNTNNNEPEELAITGFVDGPEVILQKANLANFAHSSVIGRAGETYLLASVVAEPAETKIMQF